MRNETRWKITRFFGFFVYSMNFMVNEINIEIGMQIKENERQWREKK